MIENIKQLYSQVNHKSDFIVEVAKDVKRSPNTIRHHWFSKAGFWSIPEEFQPRVVELLQNKIIEQAAKA